MINEKLDIEVYGRKLTVEIEGITQLEINSLARELTDTMARISKESDIVDSSKLAILAALEYLVEISRLRSQRENVQRAEENLLEQAVLNLRNAVDAAKR